MDIEKSMGPNSLIADQMSAEDSLRTGRAGGAEKQGDGPENLIKKLMEMLTKTGGGASGSEGSAGMDPELIKKMMAGAQGMGAMMPDSDTGRKVEV
jgi:hypothetical protein